MNSLMSLPIYLVEKLGQEEMLLVRGGSQSVSTNNSTGTCGGTNNGSGHCGGTNNGSGTCGDIPKESPTE